MFETEFCFKAIYEELKCDLAEMRSTMLKLLTFLFFVSSFAGTGLENITVIKQAGISLPLWRVFGVRH
jgi:hypothetical protein